MSTTNTAEYNDQATNDNNKLHGIDSKAYVTNMETSRKQVSDDICNTPENPVKKDLVMMVQQIETYSTTREETKSLRETVVRLKAKLQDVCKQNECLDNKDRERERTGYCKIDTLVKRNGCETHEATVRD